MIPDYTLLIDESGRPECLDPCPECGGRLSVCCRPGYIHVECAADACSFIRVIYSDRPLVPIVCIYGCAASGGKDVEP
jgi:hypothetical protein